MQQFLTFKIDHQLFALDLNSVERVIWMIEIHPLPTPYPALVGMINLHEQALPVVHLRHLFGLKEREVELEDQLIICHHHSASFALWVDSVDTLTVLQPENFTSTQEIMPDDSLIQAIAHSNQEMIFILKLSHLFTSWHDTLQAR